LKRDEYLRKLHGCMLENTILQTARSDWTEYKIQWKGDVKDIAKRIMHPGHWGLHPILANID